MKIKIKIAIRSFHKLVKSCAIVLSVLLASCDGLVKVVNPDKIRDIASKLVVESYISPQSPTIQVKVTESLPLYGENKFDPIYIKNAVVILSGESGQVRIPYDDSTNRYAIDSSLFRIESGKTYELTVSDDKRFVKAKTRVPDKVVLLKSYRIDTIPGEFEPLLAARLRCSWDDVKGETNYFSMRGYAITESTELIYNYETNESYIGRRARETSLYDFIKDIIILSDQNQDGLTLTAPQSIIPLPFDYHGKWIDSDGKEYDFDTDPKIKQVHIEILNLNESYYKFYRTLRDTDNRGNPFAEPLLIYNNIEGGIGCFGAYTVGTTDLTF